MMKTHKPNCPVRLTFSSVGSVTRPLSTVLDHVYLKPAIQAGACPRRLGDTRETVLFIESVNEYLWNNSIEAKPSIFSMDVKNFFPSVPQELALPAISRILERQNITKQEAKAVTEGLKIVRDGNFFRWQNSYYNQISGCALGDNDSCSYTDLAMSSLLDSMIPACEAELSTSLDPLFKIYRDDGLGVIFNSPDIIPLIRDFFNNFNLAIQWTIPECSACGVPLATCPHYNCLEFLDCKITWKQVPQGTKFIWQFEVSSYSKPTDCHAYIAPESCTAPHLNKKGISVAKTVGCRLRGIHSNDTALLGALHEYSGYLVARGYDSSSVKYHLSNIANRSGLKVLNGEYRPSPKFAVPLVSSLHPATTILYQVVKSSFSAALSKDPVLEVILPPSSLIVAYTKLPNLQLLLCPNDQNKLANTASPDSVNGYMDTGCQCMVCKASLFSKWISPPSMPGYSLKIPETTNCGSGPHVIYHLSCNSGSQHCVKAHYTGRASSSNPAKKAMAGRWANHKSHFNNNHEFCAFTSHLLRFHRGEDPQQFVSIQILQSAPDLETAKILEKEWTLKLFSFVPTGLNLRDEFPDLW
jgi:hypothetical protein